jgi:hypothetical protein
MHRRTHTAFVDDQSNSTGFDRGLALVEANEARKQADRRSIFVILRYLDTL